MKKILLIFLILPSVLFAQISKGQIELRFNMPKGQRYEYSIVTNTNMAQKFLEQDLNITNKVTYTYVFEVLSDSAGWKKLNAVLIRFVMNLNNMGENIVLDSDNPSKDSSTLATLMGTSFSLKKGSGFTFLINYKGDIINIKSYVDMDHKIEEPIAKDSSSRALGMQQGMEDNSFRQFMQQLFGGYPDKPVKIGSTWNNMSTVNNQGLDIVTKNTYTLESVNGNDAIVKVQSSLSSSGIMKTGVISPDMKMTGSTTGQIHYDILMGLPVSCDSDMKMEMKVNANGTDMPFKSETKISVKGRKL